MRRHVERLHLEGDREHRVIESDDGERVVILEFRSEDDDYRIAVPAMMSGPVFRPAFLLQAKKRGWHRASLEITVGR